jgi:hypothetical protein
MTIDSLSPDIDETLGDDTPRALVDVLKSIALARPQGKEAMLQALRNGARDLAFSVQHGLLITGKGFVLYRGDVVARLIEQAENVGLVEAVGRPIVEKTIAEGLSDFGPPESPYRRAPVSDIVTALFERHEDVAMPNDNVVELHPQPSIAAELGEWDAGEVDYTTIPPRGWLLGNVFCRGFVSSLLGDGAVGKTATRFAQFLSLAIGRSLTGEHVFQRCRCLIISLEDDNRELSRRLLATCLHHGIKPEELKGWLFVAAPGAKAGKLLTVDRKGNLITAGLGPKIEKVIIKRAIDIVGLDPFVKSHAVSENDNKAIDAVVEILAGLATKYDIAVDVPHHTAKGLADPGNANRGRGASAMKDAARLVYTLTPMTEDEARLLGLNETMRHLLIRMDSGKVNIAPPMTDAKWFRLVNVPLGNSTELYPAGDHVQTVEPWIPPDKWDGLHHHTLNLMLNDIEAGLPDGNRYTDERNAKDRTAWKVIVKRAPTKSEAQTKEIIKAWRKTGLLTSKDYENPVTRKKVKGLWVLRSVSVINYHNLFGGLCLNACSSECAHSMRLNSRKQKRTNARTERICPACGSPFTPRRTDATTCSNKCRQSLFRTRKLNTPQSPEKLCANYPDELAHNWRNTLCDD